MAESRNLPIIFEEEKSFGVKCGSSIQYELDGKLSLENKTELLNFAKSQSKYFISDKQVGDLYELKADGYNMVVDSSGERERIHFCTLNFDFAPISTFGSLLIAAMSFIIAVDYPVTWASFGIPFILFLCAAAGFFVGQNYIQGYLRKQEFKILIMIEKINEVLSLNTE